VERQLILLGGVNGKKDEKECANVRRGKESSLRDAKVRHYWGRISVRGPSLRETALAIFAGSLVERRCLVSPFPSPALSLCHLFACSYTDRRRVETVTPSPPTRLTLPSPLLSPSSSLLSSPTLFPTSSQLSRARRGCSLTPTSTTHPPLPPTTHPPLLPPTLPRPLPARAPPTSLLSTSSILQGEGEEGVI
jgi:hypothetical protein